MSDREAPELRELAAKLGTDICAYDCATLLSAAELIESLQQQVAELTEERELIRSQAEDATEYVLAMINFELKARLEQVTAERDLIKRMNDQNFTEYKTLHNAYQRLESEVSALRAENEWIPVSDLTRLAPSEVPLLVYHPEWGIANGHSRGALNKWWSTDFMVDNVNPTHWRPLPTPPTEEA